MNRSSSPPGLALRFFRWYCRGDRAEELEGDLEEFFVQRLRDGDPLWKARLFFWWNVFRCFRPYAIAKTQNTNSMNFLVTTYFKLAVRSLLKRKLYATVNILGLSAGAAASLLIFLYIQHEISYDDFLENGDQLYRVAEVRIYPDHTSHFALIPGGFSIIFPNEIPEIEASTRVVGAPDFAATVRYGDKIFAENDPFFADSNFFEVLPFKLLKGNPNSVLRHANTVVITESMAAKYFGEEDPMGKRLEIQGEWQEVVGIVQDVPENSHMKFNMLAPSSLVDFLQNPSFYIAGTYTYIRLAKGADPAVVEKKIVPLIEKYAAGQIERNLGVAFKDYIAAGNGYRYFLQPVQDIHLHSHLMNEIKPNGDIALVRNLGFIGLLILVIAGINFTNLSTARSTERAKEVGIRRLMGSLKKQLVFQFLAESVVMSAVSILLAVLVVYASLDFFNSTVQKSLVLDFTTNYALLSAVIGITLLLGVLAGLYPAFKISSLLPVQVLKGKFINSGEGTALRNGLVVFQFTVMVILISSTLVVYEQLGFISKKDLGFSKDNLLAINFNSNDIGKAHLLIDELGKVNGVQSVGSGSTVPGGYYYGLQFSVPGKSEIFTPKGTHVDDDFAEAMGLEIVAGRWFGKNFNDSLSVVLNEVAVKAMGLENPVGTTLFSHINNTVEGVPVPYTVVGVVKDFNVESLRTEITPLALTSMEGQAQNAGVLLVRLDAGPIQNTLRQIEDKWAEIMPGDPLIYAFMDERLAGLYQLERQSGKLLVVFTLIAVVTAFVGLFGLATYLTSQRTKEIGVRKVLGASVGHIVFLISRDFGKLLVIAFVLGCPVAWYLMRQWLNSFTYRTSLSVSTFVLVGVIIAVFTLLSISYQAISAATANPVKSLRDE